MQANSGHLEPRRRDGWVTLGITVSAVSAAFSSFAGLQSLAEVTGWGGMSPLFALSIDAYALTAIRVWLTASADSEPVRRFARWNAVLAILLSLAGNATWHLIAAGLVEPTWHIVMTVGAIPPVILGLVSHMAVLRSQGGSPLQQVLVNRAQVVQEPPYEPPVPTATLSPVPRDEAGRSSAAVVVPPPRSVDELLAAAKAADASHRAAHGQPLTRDGLRRALQVSGTRATQLHRQLRELPAKDEEVSERAAVAP